MVVTPPAVRIIGSGNGTGMLATSTDTAKKNATWQCGCNGNIAIHLCAISELPRRIESPTVGSVSRSSGTSVLPTGTQLTKGDTGWHGHCSGCVLCNTRANSKLADNVEPPAVGIPSRSIGTTKCSTCTDLGKRYTNRHGDCHGNNATRGRAITEASIDVFAPAVGTISGGAGTGVILTTTDMRKRYPRRLEHQCRGRTLQFGACTEITVVVDPPTVCATRTSQTTGMCIPHINICKRDSGGGKHGSWQVFVGG